MLATTKVNLTLMFLCLAFMVSVTSGYWRSWYEDDAPHYWSRRGRRYKDAEVDVAKEQLGLRQSKWSRLSCANTGQSCDSTRRCCNQYDTCLTHLDSNREVNTFCKDITLQVQYGEGLLEGDKCEDSSQCAHGCCREYRVLRQGRMLQCGTSADAINSQYTCISSTPN